MPTRSAEATWNGNLKEGEGTMRVGSGAFEGDYTAATRFEEEPGTNPDELIGAAHAGCFSMALANVLAQDGYDPERVHTAARVHLETVDGSPKITRIELNTEADVPGLDNDTFQEHAETAKNNCPVSKALTGVDISLNATLTAN